LQARQAGQYTLADEAPVPLGRDGDARGRRKATEMATTAHAAAVVQANRALDPGGRASHKGARARTKKANQSFHPEKSSRLFTTADGVFELTVHPALRRLNAMGHVRSSDVRRISSRAPGKQPLVQREQAEDMCYGDAGSSAQGSSSGGGSSSSSGGSSAEGSADGSTEGVTTQSEECEAEGEQQHGRFFGALSSKSIPAALGPQRATPDALRAAEKLMLEREAVRLRALQGRRSTRTPGEQPAKKWTCLAAHPRPPLSPRAPTVASAAAACPTRAVVVAAAAASPTRRRAARVAAMRPGATAGVVAPAAVVVVASRGSGGACRPVEGARATATASASRSSVLIRSGRNRLVLHG
jgi:hypothetical protein